MKREYALTVERSEGMWTVEIQDEQGVGVRAHRGGTLPYAAIDAMSFILSQFEPEPHEPPLQLLGGHP